MSDFVGYLAAKTALDNRALNPHVRQALLNACPSGPLEVLEVGAGIGTMVDRLQRWGLWRDRVRYTALDLAAANLQEAQRRLLAGGFVLRQGLFCKASLEIEWHQIDLHEFLARETRQFDLLVAHAFLDLFDLSTVMPPLLARLRPGGLFYSTLNFDGETVFAPGLELDQRVVERFHQTMDDRIIDGRPSGDSLCGRHLVAWLRSEGLEVLEQGRSDWEVSPGGADERYFLHFIVDTVARALEGLEDPAFATWVARRHAQVESGELRFRARHLDVLARLGPTRAC